MAFVARNEMGTITAVFDKAQAGADEYVSVSDPELINFLSQSQSSQIAQAVLNASDLALIRVLEDLINILIDKNVILFTDLPIAAREKLANREKIRDHLTTLKSLVSDDPGLL